MSAENGKKIVLGIGAYLILKSVLNLILFVVFAVLLVMRIPYISYIVAGFLAIVFLMNIGNNLANIGGNWIYLVEGLLDVGCAALLVLQKDVRAYFK